MLYFVFIQLFVGDHPTSLSASSVGQVVCKSILIIQLHSCLLDKNDVLHLWERSGAACIATVKVFQNGRPDTSACEDITPRNLCIHSILII